MCMDSYAEYETLSLANSNANFYWRKIEKWISSFYWLLFYFLKLCSPSSIMVVDQVVLDLDMWALISFGSRRLHTANHKVYYEITANHTCSSSSFYSPHICGSKRLGPRRARLSDYLICRIVRFIIKHCIICLVQLMIAGIWYFSKYHTKNSPLFCWIDCII